jgi:hypothetical protein
MLQAGAEAGILEDQPMGRISPLFYAVLNNNREIARLLLEAGALDYPYGFFDGPTGMYETPLGDACSRGRFEIAELMLTYGAADKKGYLDEYHRCFAEYIERALFDNKIETLQTLLQYVPEDCKPGLSLLLYYRESDPEMKALIEGRFPGIPDRYTVDKAFDGNLDTAWVEGVDGPGKGEVISFLLPHNVRGIEIFGGFGEQRYYLPNNRVKKAILRLLLLRLDATERAYIYWTEELDRLELDFDDTPRFQTFLLNTEAIPAAVEYGYPQKKDMLFAVLEITEVYPGTRWDDTCISEIKILVDE